MSLKQRLFKLELQLKQKENEIEYVDKILMKSFCFLICKNI